MASNGSGKEIEIQVSPLVSEDGIKKFKTDLQSKLNNATKDIAVTIKPTVDLTEVKNSLKTIYTDANTTTGITLRKVGFSIMSQGNIRKALQETIQGLNVEADLNVTPKKIDVSSLNTIFTDKDKVIGVTLQNVALSAKSKGHIKSAIESYLGTAEIKADALNVSVAPNLDISKMQAALSSFEPNPISIKAVLDRTSFQDDAKIWNFRAFVRDVFKENPAPISSYLTLSQEEMDNHRKFVRDMFKESPAPVSSYLTLSPEEMDEHRTFVREMFKEKPVETPAVLDTSLDLMSGFYDKVKSISKIEPAAIYAKLAPIDTAITDLGTTLANQTSSNPMKIQTYADITDEALEKYANYVISVFNDSPVSINTQLILLESTYKNFEDTIANFTAEHPLGVYGKLRTLPTSIKDFASEIKNYTTENRVGAYGELIIDDQQYEDLYETVGGVYSANPIGITLDFVEKEGAFKDFEDKLKDKSLTVSAKLRATSNVVDISAIKEDLEKELTLTVSKVNLKSKNLNTLTDEKWKDVVVPALKLSQFEVDTKSLESILTTEFGKLTVPSITVANAKFKNDTVLSDLETSINDFLSKKPFTLKPKVDFQFDTPEGMTKQQAKKNIFSGLEAYVKKHTIRVPLSVSKVLSKETKDNARKAVKDFADSLNPAVQFTISFSPALDTLKTKIDNITADKTTTVSFKLNKEKDFTTQYAAIKKTDTHKIKLSIENQQDIQDKLNAVAQMNLVAPLTLDTTQLDTKVTALEKGSVYSVTPTFSYNQKKGASALSEFNKSAKDTIKKWDIWFNVRPNLDKSQKAIEDFKTKAKEVYGDKKLHITTDLDKEAFRSTKEAIDSLFKDASTPVKSQLETVQKLVDKTYAQMVKMAQDSIKEGTKKLEIERKAQSEIHSMTMSDIKKSDIAEREAITSRNTLKKTLRDNAFAEDLRNIEKEREAYKSIINDISKFNTNLLSDSKFDDLAKTFQSIKGTLSSEMEKANAAIKETETKSEEERLRKVQLESDLHKQNLQNIAKEKNEKLSALSAEDSEERKNIIAWYAELTNNEDRRHTRRLNYLEYEKESSIQNTKLESAKAIAAAEEIASTRFTKFQAEYKARLDNEDALKAKEIANAKEVAEKRESFLSNLQGTLITEKSASDEKVSRESSKLPAQLDTYYNSARDAGLKSEIQLQTEINNLILDANTARQLSEVQLSSESDAIKAIKTEYINLFAEEQKGYLEREARKKESFQLEKLHAEDLRKSALATAEAEKQSAINEALAKKTEGYKDLEDSLKGLREALEIDPSMNLDTFKKEFDSFLKKVNTDFESAMKAAGIAYNEAVISAEKEFTESEAKRTSSHKKDMTQMKLEHEERERTLEAEKKGKLEIQISTEKAEAELTARKEANLKYIANLEAKFIEDRKSKELSAQKEVLDAERKKRAEEHASRLAEIKEETDAYKASVEARTKERVSGYLSESDLGVTKRTDSLSKTKDDISSIRTAIAEGLKGADEYEKKWSDVYSKIANKSRENAEKVYSKRIENINGEEKTKLESLQSILLHELEMNTDISKDERENIEKHYREQMKSVSETAEKERNSAKETLEQGLRSIDTYEAKASASVSKITVDKKASIEETKSAEISAIVEAYNVRKAHIDAQLNWLNKYFDTEKKHIEENSTYRRNKAKLDAEYEEGLQRAQSEYNTKVYQGTSSAETDLAIKKANIRSEAKLEQDSIFSSSDTDDIKLLKSMLVDAKAEIKDMAAEEEKSLKKYYTEKSAEQARFHAQVIGDINKELEQGKQEVKDKYAEELKSLQEKEESLRKSLDMEKEGTVSWKALKKEAKEIVEQIEKTVAARDEEIKKVNELAATRKRTEDEHYNQVIADTNSEKDIALNAVGTISKELLNEEEKKTNKAITDVQKVADTEKETAKKTQEEIARTRKEAINTYYALFDELEKRFQDLLKQRLDIIRAQNKEELKGLEIAFNYSRKQADIKRKGTNRTEDIYSKYTSQVKDDRARLREKVAEDIAKINASSLDEEEKKKQISYVKDMARAEFKHNNEVHRIKKRQEIADSLAETAYGNAVAKAENISDIEMQGEEERHSKRMDDLKNEIKVLEGKRGTMSDEAYSSQMEDIEKLIAEENKLHQEKEHNRKTTLEDSKKDAEDALRDAKRNSKEEAQDELNALNSKYNARKREKEQVETLRREEHSKILKEKEDKARVEASERAEKEKQVKAEAEASEKALAHETDVYKKELNEQLEAKRRNQKFKSEYENQVQAGKDTYKDTLKTIDTSQERKKLEEENRTKIELEKELARIRESSADEEDKRKKESEARERAAEQNKHNTILRNIETQKGKKLAFIELYKSASITAENNTHEKALADIADRKSKDLSAIAEEEYQLEQSKDKLTAEEYNNQKKELEARKKAIEDAYDLEIKREDESHSKKLRNINSRTKEASRNIELSATKKSTAEDLRYARATTDGLSPSEDITKPKASITKYTDIIKEQTSKLMALFQKGTKLVWSNYTKYGKSSIQTISNLFKSTLQKTFQGSRKLNEVLGLTKGTSEVDSVTQALSQLKSQLLGIAGISISFKTILGTTDASSELVEVQNVIDTVFGDLKESVNTFAESANRAFGLTEFQAKKFSSIFGSMFKTSGVSVEASRDMGESLTALSADLASFFDADFTEAFDKVKSGLAGMIMPLRAYGIDLSVASMKQYLLDKGIQATWSDLSIAQKQMVRYNYMLEHTTDMQGDFTKTVGSWANQLRLLKNQLRELAVIMGSFLEKVIYPIIVHLNSLLGVLIEVGKAFQKTFGFEESDLLKQQGLEDKKRGIDIGITYDDTEGTSDAIDATDDLTASTDKLTESKKKLQKENERQEASFDSLIKLSKQSTDANDASTKGNNDKKKKKGTGADLDLDPLKYKGIDLSKAPIKLPKWAKRIIKWANELKALFDKYKAKLTKGFKELKKAWEPVLNKLSDALEWLWQNVLKPFLEWLLGTGIPKTMELLTALGGVVDSVLGPIGEAAKELWKEVLEPFFKAIGNKYVDWVDHATESLKEWKKQFDALDSTDAKLEFLKVSIKNFFENTIRKYFGDRAEDIISNFYSMWDSVKVILGQVFASTDEIANGKLFSDDFQTAVENLAGAFGLLASVHFKNVLGLVGTLAQNEVPLSEIAANLADNFGKIETMVFDGIRNFIRTLSRNSKRVQKVADALTDLVTTIGKTVFTGITQAVDKLLETDVAADYIEIIKNFLNDIAKIAFDNIDELIDWLSDDDVESTIQSIANNLKDTFDNITSFLSDHKEDILNLIEKLSEFVKFASEHPNVVIGLFGTLLANKGLASIIKTPLGGILKEVGSFVGTKVTGFFTPLGTLLKSLVTDVIGPKIVAGITSLVGPIAAAVGLPVTAVIGIIAAAVASIVAIVLNWDKIKKFFTETVPAFFKNKFKPWLESLGTKLNKFIESLPGRIKSGLKTLAKAFGIALGAWITSEIVILGTIGHKIKDWVFSIPDKLSKWWESVVDSWKQCFQLLADAMPSSLDELGEDIWNGLGYLKDFLIDIGKQIVDWIVEGAKSHAGSLGDILDSLGDGVSIGSSGTLKWFENLFGKAEDTSDKVTKASDNISKASDSMKKSADKVQKSADDINLENAIKNIEDLADAYEEATDASNAMKLSSSIDELEDYYAQLYAAGKLSASEYGAQIDRLEGYKATIKKASSGLVDILRDSRQSSNSELDLFSEDFIDWFQSMQEHFGDDFEGFGDYLRDYIKESSLTDEQKQVFYETIFPMIDSATQENIKGKVENNLVTARDAGVDAANKNVSKKLDLEATVPDKDSPEAAKAGDKAEEQGKTLSKKLKKGAQEEANKGKLSTETYIKNGSEDNKKVAKKQGTDTAKELANAAQTEVDTRNIGINKMFDNASGANKTKAEETGTHLGKETKKGAQDEVNKGKLSAETYINNGSENNKEVAKKEGTKTGKTITESAQEYADSKSVTVGTALENAESENKAKATKEGNKTGATAVSTMRNTVSSSKVNLADSLDIQITQNKVLYVAAAIQNLLISAMSRIHTIDLSSKFSFSGSSQNLPLAYSAPVYASGRMGNLPHLAKGAVIPPRSKFLAVLGDQRSGYNIETPLDTMIDAFKIALQDTGLLNKGTDQPIQLTVQIGSEKLDDRIVNVVDSRNTRSGGL